MLTEFNRTLTEQEQALLTHTREEMMRKHPSGNYVDKSLAMLWQNRVKKASKAYKELQALAEDYDQSITSENDGEATLHLEADAYAPEQLPSWPTFRDNFILDWMSNRIVVTEEEADEMFNQDAESALNLIEGQEQSGGESLNTSEPAVSSTIPAGEAPSTTEATPVAKRRGRPPGTKNSTKKVVKAARKSKAKAPRKVKAAAKVGRKASSNSAKAQKIVEMYKAKGWERKRVIEKLMTQLEMGKAYASTLYQKYA